MHRCTCKNVSMCVYDILYIYKQKNISSSAKYNHWGSYTGNMSNSLIRFSALVTPHFACMYVTVRVSLVVWLEIPSRIWCLPGGCEGVRCMIMVMIMVITVKGPCDLGFCSSSLLKNTARPTFFPEGTIYFSTFCPAISWPAVTIAIVTYDFHNNLARWTKT